MDECNELRQNGAVLLISLVDSAKEIVAKNRNQKHIRHMPRFARMLRG